MDPTDRVLEKSDFMEALKASVDEVKEVWRRYQKDQMSRRLPYPTQSSLGTTSQVDSDSDTPPPAQVDLATSVFYCPGCVKRYKYASGTFLINPCYIGWEQVRIHLTCDKLFPAHGYRQLVFGKVGQRVARTLIKSVGLDPERATARGVEALDRRFICGGCLEGVDGDQGVDEGQWVLTWTECIPHQVEMYHRRGLHNTPSRGSFSPQKQRPTFGVGNFPIHQVQIKYGVVCIVECIVIIL